MCYDCDDMRLRASFIDRELKEVLLKERVAGTTLAVYDRVVYLRPHEGSLLILAQMSVGNGPGFILLQHQSSLRNGRPSFCPDEQFKGEKGLVKIGGDRIIIETGRADTWDPSFVPAGTHRLDELETCITITRELARSRRISSGLGPLLDRLEGLCSHRHQIGSRRIPETSLIVYERVRAFAEALSRGREAEVRDAAQRLIGLGEGLTPSCDDLLVGLAGFFHGVRCVPSLDAYARRALAWLGELMESAAERTTPVSSHFLREAGRGRFTERVKNLLGAIFSADEKRVERAAHLVLEYGATSGVDLIFGIALGYEIERRRSSLVAHESSE